MATNFKEQFPGNGQLPHRLREQFYHTMKQTVVVVRVNHDTAGVTNWGGVCVGPEGLVVTAAHFLRPNPKALAFRCHGESKFVQAKIIHIDEASNLALLRRVGSSRDIHYAECCSRDDIRVGKEAIAIGHPCNFVYTIAIGHVAFPADGIDDPFQDLPVINKTCNKRRFRDCYFGENGAPNHLKVLRNGLHLIQLNNIHGSMSSAGSGIFNSVGLLMGIEVFVLSNFDFCVHVSTLQKFIEQGLEAEKTEGGSSQGLMEIEKTEYSNTKEKGKAKGRIEGKTVSLTKLITEREHVKPHNLRPLEDKIHTLTSKYCWKKTFESDQGTSAIADSDERTCLDGGFLKISSGKSVTVKNQIKFDVESIPQNKNKLHSDKLDKCELSGDFTRLSSFEMDILDLDFSCRLKKTENAGPNVSFLSDSGDGSTASPKQLSALYSGEMNSVNIYPDNNNSVQFTRGLSGQMSATRTSKEILLNPFSSIATRKFLPEISVEQDISLGNRGLNDITNLQLPGNRRWTQRAQSIVWRPLLREGDC